MSLLTQWQSTKSKIDDALWWSDKLINHKKLYTELEYIQSTGTQWIDTGVIGASNIKIVLVGTMISSASTWNTIFGAKSSSGLRYQVALNNEKAPYFYFNNMSSNKSGTLGSAIWGRKFTLTFGMNDGLVIAFDAGTTFSLSIDSAYKNTFTTGTNIPLLCRNGGDWSHDQPSRMKIYSCKLYDITTNTLLRDFIPVRTVNGVICLYDKVSDAYCYNGGTGNFTAGPEI